MKAPGINMTATIIAGLLAIIGVVSLFSWESGDSGQTAETQHSRVATVAINTSSPCAKPEKVIARPGRYTEVRLKSRCAWKTVNVPISLKHEQACLSFRANKNNNLTKKEGVCPGGSFKAHFASDMELTDMEVTSLESFEVPLMVMYFYQ